MQSFVQSGRRWKRTVARQPKPRLRPKCTSRIRDGGCIARQGARCCPLSRFSFVDAVLHCTSPHPLCLLPACLPACLPALQRQERKKTVTNSSLSQVEAFPSVFFLVFPLTLWKSQLNRKSCVVGVPVCPEVVLNQTWRRSFPPPANQS